MKMRTKDVGSSTDSLTTLLGGPHRSPSCCGVQVSRLFSEAAGSLQRTPDISFNAKVLGGYFFNM